jgi:large subunit ribosomal protein L23|tara:strand:- start:222 stop:509 length:288 start_codon:yes stop_codon:yes gene_type:complete
MSSVYDVLLKPVVTEKSTTLQEQGKYVFEVTLSANKRIVKEAIEKAFQVNVLSVNMLMNRGKLKRVGQKYSRSKDKKKAIVTLKPGDKIEIFEGA